MFAQWVARWGLLAVGAIVSAVILAAEAWVRAHRSRDGRGDVTHSPEGIDTEPGAVSDLSAGLSGLR